MKQIRLSDELERELFISTWESIQYFLKQIESNNVSSKVNKDEIKRTLDSIDLDFGISPRYLTDIIIENLKTNIIHNQSPAYFGIDSNGMSTIGILTETIIAAFNPQLSTWRNSPFAYEIEKLIIDIFCGKVNFSKEYSDGIFTSGYPETHQSVIQLALNNRFQNFGLEGIRSFNADPVIYVTEHSHPNIKKAVRFTGLGSNSIKMLPLNEYQEIDVEKAKKVIKEDISSGKIPLLILASGGNDFTGAVDPIIELVNISKEYNIWLHVDLLYGASMYFINSLEVLLEGIEYANSISIDINRLLFLPSDSNLLLTTKGFLFEESFECDDYYTPTNGKNIAEKDSFSKSMQWSRRFDSLKAYMSLATIGWKGYEEIYLELSRLSILLKNELLSRNWIILNKSQLPILCFTKWDLTVDDLYWICNDVISSGRSWLSVISISKHTFCFRVVLNNHKTSDLDIFDLVACLELGVEKVQNKPNRSTNY